MNTALSRQKRRRFRRLMRRGRLIPAEATALSVRTRLWYPKTRDITRYHRYKWRPKPRHKWSEFEEYERYAS